MNRYALFLVAVIACFLLFILLVTTSAMETTHSPLAKTRYSVLYFIPEGWGFFTRDPREPSIDLYRIDSRNKTSLVSKPNGDASFFFGASRLGRRYGMEISMILKNVNTRDWKFFRSHHFSDSVTGLKEIKMPLDKIQHVHYIKKGNYLLVYHETIPWPYLNQAAKYRRKWGLIRLSII